MNTKLLYTCIFAIMAVQTASFSATINVPGDQINIQAAIAAVPTVNGDIISIADGAATGVLAASAKGLNYQGNISGTQSNIIMGANGFILTGVQTSLFQDLLLTGGTTKSTITSAQTTTVSNMTFDSNTATTNGAGITNSGNMTLNTGNVFNANTAGSNGAAIANTGILTINTGNNFSNNTAKFGGAIHNSVTGKITIAPGVIFNGNTVQAAAAHSQMGGGAIYNTGAGTQFTIDDAIFTNNMVRPTISATSGSGGAIYTILSTANNTVSNSTFTGNEANVAGGAIYSSGTLTLTGNEFIGNKSSGNSGGGAVYNTGTLTSSGNTFLNNEGVTGGAISGTGTSLIIDSNIFTGNKAGYGGAISASATNSIITNSTFTLNEATAGNGGSAIYATKDITVSDCDFTQNTSTLGTVVFKGAAGTTMYLNAGNTFENNTSSGAAAAVVVASGTVRIDENEFKNNTAGGGGGAITVGVNAIAFVKNSIFDTNIANGNSGGVFNLNRGSLTLETGNVFINNEVKDPSGYGGGVVYLNGLSTLDVTGNQFIGNKSAGNSGVIHNQGSGAVTVGTSLFQNNTAALTGGAIMNHLGTANMTLSAGNVFQGNTAKRGGGAISNTGLLHVTDNTFIDNTAISENTGTTALGLSGGAVLNTTVNALLELNNATFSGNTVYNFGGADSGTEVNRAVSGFGGTVANILSTNANFITDGAITNSTVYVKDINYYYGILATQAEIDAIPLAIDKAKYYTLDNGPIVTTVAGGGAISNTGTLTINGTNITNSLVKVENITVLSQGVSLSVLGGAIYNSGTLTINGGTNITGNSIITTNTPVMTIGGGAVYNSGTLHLNTDVGNIVFGGTGAADINHINGVANDILAGKDSVTNIDGTANDVIVYGGISSGVFNADPLLDTLGTATINKSSAGQFLINGNSAEYTGIFNQTAGTTIATAAYFGGQTNIQAGTVELAQGASISNTSIFNIASGAELLVSTDDNMNVLGGQINGHGSGFGTVNKTGAGILNVSGDHSAFTGDFNLLDGVAIADANSKLFGGQNTVSNATLQVTSDSVYYNATIGNNGILNHISTVTDPAAPAEINGANINFAGTNGTMNFASNSTQNATYNLVGKMDNGNANTVNFNNAAVGIGDPDFTGATVYNFNNNSVLQAGETTDIEFTKLNINNSVIDLRSSGSTFNNLTIQNYVGTNAKAYMNIALGDDNSSTDKIIITSTGTATGATSLYFTDTNTTDSSAQTINGIKVIDAQNGATINSTAFSLAGGALDTGAYEYKLFQGNVAVGGTDDQSFFLRSTQNATNAVNTMLNIPIIHLEIVQTGMNNLRKRLGEIRYNDKKLSSSPWIRTFVATLDVDGAISSSLNLYGTEGGYDFKFNTGSKKTSLYAGIMAGYEFSDSIETIQTNGYIGNGSTSTPSFGAYITWFNDAGWFIDATARYFMVGMEMTPYTALGVPMTMNPDREFIATSIETGKRFGWGDAIKKIVLEPKTELQYVIAGAKSFDVANNNNNVDYQKTQSILPKAGAKVSYYNKLKNNAALEPFIEIMVGYELDGLTNVKFAGAEFNSDLGGLYYEVSVGLNAQIKNNISLYLDANYEASSVTTSIGGNLGFRYQF